MNRASVLLLSACVLILTFFIQEYPKFKAYSDNQLNAYFFDVGQGDSSLIKTPNQKLILVDGGRGNDVLFELSKVLPFTVNKIDLIVVSHSHADHIAGLIDVIENYKIGCVVYDWNDGPISLTEEYFRSQLIDQNIMVVEEMDSLPNECFYDDSISLDFYNMSQEKQFKNQNLESLLMLLDYKDFEVLYTGDAEVEIQKALFDSINEDVEVLKVPHQGARDSFYLPLLAKIKPDLAIISVGEGNRYGHPHKEVIGGYKKLGIPVVRTDQNGTVMVNSDGETWQFNFLKD